MMCKKMFDHFGLLAPVYDWLIGPPEKEKLFSILQLSSNGWLLDAGGSTGRVSACLRKMVRGIVISDLSMPMLHKAKTKNGISPVQSYIEKLPFQDNTFERVLIVDALHHFCSQHGAIAECLRVLKPGGILLIEEPNINRFAVKFVALFEKIIFMRSQFYVPAEMCNMIEKCGCDADIMNEDRFRVWIRTRK